MDNNVLKEFNVLGVIVGFIFWIALLWYLADELECMRHNSCDNGDMVSFAILGLGYLVPAGIVALIASIFTKRKK